MNVLAGFAASYMHRSQGRPSLAYHKRLPLRHPLGGYQRPSVVEIQLVRDQMEIKNLHLPSVFGIASLDDEYYSKPLAKEAFFSHER